MPDHQKSRKDEKKRGLPTGSKTRTDTATLESKLKKVTLDDRHQKAGSGGRALPQSQVHKPAPKKVSAKQKVQAYLHQQRIHAFSKTPLPQFLYTLAAQQQSRGFSYGSGVPAPNSASLSQFGLGGFFPADPGRGALGGRDPRNMTIPMPTGAEAFNMTSYNANYIDGIQIWRLRSNGQPECLQPGQPRFDIMAAAIMLGFDIMESQAWRSRMRSHASSMFSYIVDTAGLPLPPGRVWSDEAIHNYSEDFIRRCRQNSPVAILHDLGNSVWARTLKADWSGRGYFNPQLSATVEYNIQIIDRIDYAAIAFRESKHKAKQYAERRDERHYEQEIKRAKHHLQRYHSMITRIGMTVAHEMEHVFTGYLLKDPLAHTPPDVTYGPGFGDDAVGESGRFLEAGVFGGFLDMKLEVPSRMEVIAVRTYAQTFILSYDQVKAIIRRQWNILPTYDPEGDSYEGPPRVAPPKKVDLDKWRDELRYNYILIGRTQVPGLSRSFRENIRRGLYGGLQYRLNCKSLRDYSDDPRSQITVLGSAQVIVA